MSSMDFGEVLSKAWRIIWKHKVLWIFGIFAGCSRGGGSGGGGGGSGWEENFNQGQPFGPGTTSGIERFFSQAGQWIGDHWWVVALIVLAILILAVLAIFLGTIGKIGLIRGTFQADGGAEKLRFSELFRESRPFFWRVFLLSFLIGLAFLFILAPLTVIGIVTAGVGFLCLLPLLCILVPVLWVVGLVVQQADVAMVVENLSIMDGVRRGWDVVRKNVGPVLVIWLITAVIGVAIGIVLAIPMLVIVVPAIVGFATSRGEFPTVALTLSGLCLVVYAPILVVAQGILTAYIESVWTLTFLRLTKPPVVPGSASALPAHA